MAGRGYLFHGKTSLTGVALGVAAWGIGAVSAWLLSNGAAVSPGQEGVAWVALCSLLFYTAYVIRLAKNCPDFFLISFQFLFGYWGASLGGVLIESGAYISEQFRYGFQNGATLHLVLYSVLLVAVARPIFHALRAKIHIEGTVPEFYGITRVIATAINLLLLVLGGLSLATLAVRGTALTMGVDRFTLKATVLPAWMGSLDWYFIQLVFLSSLSAALFGKSSLFIRHSSRVGFLGALASLVLYGEKYTGLVNTTYVFLLPILLTSVREIRRPTAIWRALKRYLPLLVLIAAVSFSLIIYHYVNIYSQGGDPFEMLNRRLALQGHVWWGIDEQVLEGWNWADAQRHLVKEIDMFPSWAGPYPLDRGMGYLMTLVAPPELVNAYHARGVRFTMGYPAIALVLCGYGGLISFQILAAAILASYLAYFWKTIVNGQFVRSFIMLRVHFMMIEVFTMGQLYRLFGYQLATYVAVIVLLELTSVYLRSRGKAMPQWV